MNGSQNLLLLTSHLDLGSNIQYITQKTKFKVDYNYFYTNKLNF